MQVPNVPTDNLYKFMALSGVLLLTLSVGYYLHRISMHDVENANLRVGKEKLHQTMKNWGMKLDARNFYVNKLIAGSELELKNENPDIQKLKEISQKLSKEYSNLIDNRSIIERDMDLFTDRSMDLRLQSELADASVSATKRIGEILPFMACLGLILIYSGFALWYLKLQKYQDLKIKSEAENI